MNPTLEQWLASCARASGMIGCGVRLSDQTCASHSFNEDLPQTHLVETLRCLGELSPVLAEQGLFPRQCNWTFETGQMRVVSRPDGALLALLIKRRSPAAETLDALAEEFLALKLTD